MTVAPPQPGAVLGDLTDVLAGIAERAAGHDADGSFAFEAFDALWARGALNLTIPEAAGGLGGGLAVAAEVVASVGAADPSVALVLSQHLMFHYNLQSPTAAVRWPADVLAKVRRSSLDGVALINALRVERDLGTPGRGGLPTTVAARLPGDAGWRLNGRKIYSTGSPLLRWMLVWARSDDEPDPLVGFFLADSHTSAPRIERTWDSLGMRATRSDDTVFEDADIPFDHAVGVSPASAGLGGIEPSAIVSNALMVSAVYQGVARSARDWLATYLNERTPSNLGAPLASLPRFHEEFGRIEARVAGGDRALAGMAREIDADPTDLRAAMGSQLVKYEVTNGAIDAVLAAVRLIGNPGLLREHPLERHLRNVLHGPVHSPQDDTILATTGRAALRAAAPDPTKVST